MFKRASRRAGHVAALATLTLATPSLAAAPQETATPHANPACRAGQTYVAQGNVPNPDGIVAIFADTVDFTGPDGVHRNTRAEIATVYKRFSGKVNMVRRVAHFAPIDERSCLVEMESSEDGGPFSPNAVAHFEVNADGKVVRFLPFVLTARARWLRDVIQK